MLIKPIKRLPRYVLLIQDLFSKTPVDHPDHEPLQKALEQILLVSTEVDSKIHEHEQRQRLLSAAAHIGKKASTLIRADRKLIKDAVVMFVTPECTKISKGLHLWLFNDMLAHVTTSKSSSNVASTKYQWPLELIWLKNEILDPRQSLRNGDKYQHGFSLIGPRKEDR